MTRSHSRVEPTGPSRRRTGGAKRQHRAKARKELPLCSRTTQPDERDCGRLLGVFPLSQPLPGPDHLFDPKTGFGAGRAGARRPAPDCYGRGRFRKICARSSAGPGPCGRGGRPAAADHFADRRSSAGPAGPRRFSPPRSCQRKRCRKRGAVRVAIIPGRGSGSRARDRTGGRFMEKQWVRKEL